MVIIPGSIADSIKLPPEKVQLQVASHIRDLLLQTGKTVMTSSLLSPLNPITVAPVARENQLHPKYTG